MSSLSPFKRTVLQDWLSPDQPSTMKVTTGKLLSVEEMESRVPSLTHMVGQTYANSKGKSDKKQVPYGIPQFLLAFGLDASSPKPIKLNEQGSAFPNLFVQLFVNAAHARFGQNYIGSIRQLVLDMAVSDKTSFFGPEKANAKSAADSLLKTRFGGGAASREGADSLLLLKTPCGGGAVSRQGADSDTQEAEATSAESVDLETSNWTHVVCSLDATNIVDKRTYKRDPKMTKLKSIAGTGIGDINRKALGSWCSRNGITGTRTIQKDLVCHKILTFVTNMERMQAGVGEGAKSSGNFNRYRGINVLIGERMRPHINQLGNLPSRDELDAGSKTNQQFFTNFVAEYNKRDVPFYDTLHHELEWKTQKPKPKMFSDITWKKAADAMTSLSTDYDKSFSMWKQSGRHDQAIPLPFNDFSKNRTILYLHLSVYEIKDLLSKVTSEYYDTPNTIHQCHALAQYPSCFLFTRGSFGGRFSRLYCW
jgi:hypothetical protein